MHNDVVIRASGLAKSYRIFERPSDRLLQFLWRGKRQYFREFKAIDCIDFKIGRGDAVGIIGRNGSGKSTLLQLIAGTLSPTSGEIQVAGRISALLELGSGFNPEFSGYENVFINGAILGLNHDEIERRMPDILEFADIGDFIEQPVKTYSSGMLMRLAFAVSVCTNPEILIVDEALAVGDAAFQFKCLERLAQLIASGTTLLFVSHDLALVKTYCQRAMYLRRGRMVYIGSADEAAEQYLQDLRSDQRQGLARDEASQVVRKSALAGPDGIAFGTQLGRIVAAEFVGCAGRREIYSHDALVHIRCVVEYGPEVKHPRLAIAIADRRNVVIAGRFSPVLPIAEADWLHLSVDFTFRARLGEGHYLVTAVLEDRPGQLQGLLVEKQAGVLLFDVMKPNDVHAFIGTLDLGIKIGHSVPERLL